MKRRWFQISLRTLLLLMLLVGVFFAGRMSLQLEMQRLRAEADAARQEAGRATRATSIPIYTIPVGDFEMGPIEKGMKADEMEMKERLQRQFQDVIRPLDNQ